MFLWKKTAHTAKTFLTSTLVSYRPIEFHSISTKSAYEAVFNNHQPEPM